MLEVLPDLAVGGAQRASALAHRGCHAHACFGVHPVRLAVHKAHRHLRAHTHIRHPCVHMISSCTSCRHRRRRCGQLAVAERHAKEWGLHGLHQGMACKTHFPSRCIATLDSDHLIRKPLQKEAKEVGATRRLCKGCEPCPSYSRGECKEYLELTQPALQRVLGARKGRNKFPHRV